MAPPMRIWQPRLPNQMWNWKLMQTAEWPDKSVSCVPQRWLRPPNGNLIFLKDYLAFARKQRRPPPNHHGALRRAIDTPLDAIWPELNSIHGLKLFRRIC